MTRHSFAGLVLFAITLASPIYVTTNKTALLTHGQAIPPVWLLWLPAALFILGASSLFIVKYRRACRLPRFSRDAEILYATLKKFGGETLLVFDRAQIIHPRMLAALEELAAAGFVQEIPHRLETGRSWIPTKALRNSKKRCRAPQQSESYPMVSEKDAQGVLEFSVGR